MEAAGMSLAVSDAGSGPALLLLHPFPLDSNAFAAELEPFAR